MNYKKLFVYAPTQAIFEVALRNEVADKDAIAFIDNPREIWAQGIYYPCPYSKEELDDLFQNNKEEFEKIIEKLKGNVSEDYNTLEKIENKIEGLSIVEVPAADTTILKSYELHNANDEKRGVTINIPKDQTIKDIKLSTVDASLTEDGIIVDGTGGTALCISYVLANGTYKLVVIDYSKFIEEREFGDGLEVINHTVYVRLDPSSESYLVVDENGIKIVGIDNKFSELGKTITDLNADVNNKFETVNNTLENLDSRVSTNEQDITNIYNKIDDLVGDESVQDQIKTALEDYLPLSGGTMTGNITFGSESTPGTNGHEYVDLGLPSGNLWAKCNIGASSEEEAGLYFQWGDTQGYTAEQVGSEEGQKAFSWTDYKFSIDGSDSNLSKYNASDSKTVLDSEDDAAHVNMGGNWRMPTLEEYKELLFNTDIYLVPTEGEEIQGTVQEQSGSITINWASQAEGTLKGVKFYKKGDKQTYMFVPASGNAGDGFVQDVGESGYLWPSSLYSSGVQGAWYFSFNAGIGLIVIGNRSYGASMRGVCPKSDSEDYTGGIIISGKSDTDLVNAAGGTTTIDSIREGLATEDELNQGLQKYLPLTGGNMDGNIVFDNNAHLDFIVPANPNDPGVAVGTPIDSSTPIVDSSVANDDKFSIRLGGQEDVGYVILATEGDATEPIYIAQVGYPDDSGQAKIVKLITLMDGNGNQIFNNVTANGFVINGKSTQDLINAGGSTISIDELKSQMQVPDGNDYVTWVAWSTLSKIITSISQNAKYTTNSISISHTYKERGSANNQYGSDTSLDTIINAATSTTAGVLTADDYKKLVNISLGADDLISRIQMGSSDTDSAVIYTEVSTDGEGRTHTKLVLGTQSKTDESTTGFLVIEDNVVKTLNPNTSQLDRVANISEVNSKQDILVSGTNIKTINGQSLLGSGDLQIGVNIITIE